MSCASCQEEVARIKASPKPLKAQEAHSAPEGFTKETMLLIKERNRNTWKRKRMKASLLTLFCLPCSFCKGFVERGCHFLKYLPHPAYSFRRKRDCICRGRKSLIRGNTPLYPLLIEGESLPLLKKWD